MKNLIHTVPKEWLEEKESWELKKIIILKYEHYIRCTEKNNSSSSENELFCLVFEKTRYEH